MLRHEGLQGFRRDRRIGENEAQHGRHIRGDHPGAFAEAVDCHLGIADQRRSGRELRIGVRRHDRARGFFERVGLGALCEIGQQVRKFRRIQRLADNPCRGDEHFVRLAADGFDSMFDCDVDGLTTAFTGEGIGIAGVDDESPRAALLQVLAANENRRRRGLRLRQDSRNRGSLVQHSEQKIGTPLIANTGFSRCKCHALDRRQAGERCRRKRRNARNFSHGQPPELARGSLKQIGPL